MFKDGFIVVDAESPNYIVKVYFYNRRYMVATLLLDILVRGRTYLNFWVKVHFFNILI